MSLFSDSILPSCTQLIKKRVTSKSGYHRVYSLLIYVEVYSFLYLLGYHEQKPDKGVGYHFCNTEH